MTRCVASGHRPPARTASVAVVSPSTAAARYCLLLVDILPAPTVDVVLHRDSVPLRWTPIAKDGADLQPAARVARAARRAIGVGETYDVSWTPERAGDAELVVNVPDGFPTIRVPIRVRP